MGEEKRDRPPPPVREEPKGLGSLMQPILEQADGVLEEVLEHDRKVKRGEIPPDEYDDEDD